MFIVRKFAIFCWIISIYNGNTHGALKFTFTSPVHIVKNFNLPHGQKSNNNNNNKNNDDYHQSIIEMKSHIKKVLNMQIMNSTLDKYIEKMFNFHNLNPTYVFRLPDNTKNKTLIFRKSDFSVAVFPNITNVNKFKKMTPSIQQVSSSKQQLVKGKSEEILEELKHERLIFQKNLNGNYEDVDYDENMMRIVEENVRSEKEFIKFMRDLNEDLDEDELRLKFQQQIQGKKKPVQDEWEELGLKGWSGTMSANKDELPKKERSNSKKKINAVSVQVYQGFDPFSFLKTTKPSSSHINNNEDAEIAMEELTNQLSSILLEDEQILLNKTGRLPNMKPRWPITSTRDQHYDSDIFIGRANNPFGHSIKWKFRNTSDNEESHREGRSKRGVINLYSMIKCATGCDPLQYKGYGCYCGFLGSGRALDGIDRCCKAHDFCYGNANCFFYTEYLVPYLWKCYRGKPLCAIDNGEWGGPNSCATKLCECDRALSKCLRHYYCPRKRPVCTSNPFRLLQNLVMVF